VVFFHGGGFVIGDLDSHDNLARTLCRDAQAVVVAVAYRMGPEHRFPAAPNDSFAATRWVAEHAAELGGDASRLAVCGDSAGGNLSAVVTQLARDAGGPAIRFAALIYPTVDMTLTGGSLDENAKGYFLEKDDMDWFMSHYLNSDDDRPSLLASPALHPNLAGLPPCFITTCEFDPLRDEGEAYGATLRANGIAAENKRYDGLIHGAASMAGLVDGGRQMLADVGDRLRTALH
jgi:acetyl esterase